MTEADTPPDQRPEEETSVQTLIDMGGLEDVIECVRAVVRIKRAQKTIEKELKEREDEALERMRAAPDIHAIRLEDGSLVSRAWSVRATVTPEPDRLRQKMADAEQYIRTEPWVDMPKLRKEMPTVWEELGKVKRRETVVVRLKGEKDEP